MGGHFGGAESDVVACVRAFCVHVCEAQTGEEQQRNTKRTHGANARLGSAKGTHPGLEQVCGGENKHSLVPGLLSLCVLCLSAKVPNMMNFECAQSAPALAAPSKHGLWDVNQPSTTVYHHVPTIQTNTKSKMRGK